MNTGGSNIFNKSYAQITSAEYTGLKGIIHAYDIHQFRGTPENQRPRISERKLEQAYALAYERLLTALKYFEDGEADSETDVELRGAARLLEMLYLKRPLDTPHRTEELYTAALAYYLAGDYPRSFVIMGGIRSHDEGPMNLMRLMFLRELSTIKQATLRVLSQEDVRDKFLAENVTRGVIEEKEALEAACHGTLNRIYALFYEYARTGKDELLSQALALSSIGRQLAIDQRLQDWWWTFQCALALLREYQRNSLWTCLRSMMEDDTNHLVRRYIKAAFFRRQWPVLELWRPQSHVAEHIKDGRSYCLKMPTSSGKTRIAELAILKFLLDTQETPEKKCIYIAPYRALAVEVEQSLRRSFEPIGIRVSQLYGGADLNPADSLLIGESRILIATPEKIDSVLRYNADLAKSISLIIVDEGHIIDAGERGLRYELFMHRLVRRYERNGVRMLFISAVMPNVEQFAEWITGRSGREGVLESDWRASDLSLGILYWDGERIHVDYTHRDRVPLNRDIFIRNYASGIASGELKAIGDSRRRFPLKNASKGSIIAITTIQTTSEGATLVFVPRKNWLESTAEAIIEAVQMKEKINDYFQRSCSVLHVNTDNSEKTRKLERCIRYAEEATGADSIVVRALKCGFVIHHGDVPRFLRVHLEELIREGILQLVVATNTLAQGVNFPVKTILIHSLQQGEDRVLSIRDFWNICGRAGRAMYETEGHVFLVAKSRDERDRARAIINSYVEKAVTEEVVSAIRQLLEGVANAWQNESFSIDPIDIAELCQRLTDSDDAWLGSTLQRKLRILDTQLLALLEEQQLDITEFVIDDFKVSIADLFKDSMLIIQLNSAAKTYISKIEALSLIVQRIQHISRIYKTKQRRHCFYSMGISLQDCVMVEQLKPELMSYLQRAKDYMDWSVEERAKYIVQLCADFLMKLNDVRFSEDDKEPPDSWSLILQQWLMGKNAAEIAISTESPDDLKDAMKISILIDDLCDFRLPWGLNAVSMFWKKSANLDGDGEEMSFTPPEVVSYFASMLQFGVHHPAATVALALGLGHRQASLILSKHYDGPIDAQSIFSWLRGLDEDGIHHWTDDEVMQRLLTHFIKSVHQRGLSDLQEMLRSFRRRVVEVKMPTDFQYPLVEEGIELMSHVEDDQVHLYTQAIDYLGVIPMADSSLLKDLQDGKVSITVKKVDRDQNDLLLTLLINRTRVI